MKKIFIIVLVIGMSSCGALNRSVSGATINNLKEQVAIEQGCEEENIKLLDKQQAAGNATYALDVCGTRMVYKQVGSVFMEASKADSMMN